jgi:monoamine oxidase
MDADVIVIGAGAAGLAAARVLAGGSLRVIVLEARDRTGGRVWTGPSASYGVPAELGAEFIHGPAPETRALLRDAGTAWVDTGGESWSLGRDGKLTAAGDFSAAWSVFEDVHALAADESVDRYLRRFDGDAKKRAAVADARRFVEGFDAADPAIASVKAIADEWESGVDDTSARALGGYRPVFDQLLSACDALGVERQLASVVRRITWRRGEVSVDVTSGSEARTLRARAAIVTLPVGVLRHSGDDTAVAFEPELPAAKRHALGFIEMGLAVKVMLRFRTAFWERVGDGRYRDAGFFRCFGRPFTAFWTQLPVRSELICAWAGGPHAIALDAAPPAELIDRALEEFGMVLGDPVLARAEFEGGVMHDWGRDPFARGAYSYVAVGGGDARLVLAAPVDDALFFGGEATANDGQGGTVNGAFATGERAAREALAALGIAAVR